MLLNFVSMFIVVPYLTSNAVVYGIYSVCISVAVFFNFADIGFIASGKKYAAEYYVQNKRNEEIRVIGFSCFILLVFSLFVALAFFVFSLNPSLLIRDLGQVDNIKIASQLLLILSIFAPLAFLQRLLKMIFDIRIESYIFQRINIIVNTLKILSVFWFFRANHYDIVGYYLFWQISTYLGYFVGIYIAKKRYQYDIGLLFRSLRFDKTIYNKTKRLAFSGLFATIAWTFYFSMDSMAIGKLMGATQVAYFAIGLSLLNVLRSLYGVIFTPFVARFNHFEGKKDDKGMRDFYLQVVRTTAPILVLSTICLGMLMKPFILSWVGTEYTSAIIPAQILIYYFIFGFISYPASALFNAKVRIKIIYVIAALNVSIFWIGVGLTYKPWGIESFAIFKICTMLLAVSIQLYYSLKILDIRILEFLKETILPLLFPSLLLVSFFYFVLPYLPMEKGKMNLLIVIGAGFLVLTITGMITLLVSKKYRELFRTTLLEIRSS